MAKIWSVRICAVLVIVAVLPNAFAAPQRGSHSHEGGTCAPSCRRGHDSKLKYEQGKSYVYEFSSEAVTRLLGSSQESTKVQVQGQAVVAAQSSCDFVLTLQQASVLGPSGQTVSGVEGLEGSSVRFALQDGAIEGLCVSENDPTWSANIKRALVSMLQNKALKNAGESLVSETDISGRCPTQYSIQGDRYTKKRDLNSCTDREGGNTIFYGVAYHIPSKLNSLPSVNSNLTCTQTLQNGVMQSVLCEEKHFLEAFSNGGAGAQTIVSSSLTLRSVDSGLQGAKSAVASKPSTILFDHSESQKNHLQKKSSTYTADILVKLCEQVKSGVVSAQVPELFLELQKSMKTARLADLKSLRQQILQGQLCQNGTRKMSKLLMDAAAISVTDAAVGLVADAYAANQLDQETKSYFELYMTFAPQPGHEALHAVGKLLEQLSEPSNDLILAASGMAHQYCKMTNPACGQDSDYVHLVKQIAAIADSNCMSHGPIKAQKAIAALQALGNLDNLPEVGVAAVKKCLLGSERIQIRALDAFRRDPCQRELKEQAKEILADKSRTAEVRIQAYLTISKCMEAEDVEAVQQVLNKAKSNQVLSFIASHVHNQLHAVAPEEQQLKSTLRQIEIPSHIPSDLRKYSKNYEWSTFNAESNVGGSVDGNVIFSQHSYVPRMASGNMTVHAFGRSYNLVELGLYLENFEHALEKYFGPKGSFKDSTVGGLWTAGKERFNNLVRTRNRRDVEESAPQFDENEVEQYHGEVELKKRYGDNGVGDVYVRVLGTSILVNSFSQDGQFSMGHTLTQGMSSLMRGAKSHKVDITQPIVFMNDEITVPTISGFPIKLDVKGTTVLSLEMSGDLNFDKFFQEGQDSQSIRAKISPSAATLIKAKMTTGCGPIEAGLQVEGKVQTSSALDVAMQRGNGELDMKVNLPQEKTQVLDVRTDLFWVEQEAQQPERKLQVHTKTQTRSYADPNKCMMSDILGLKFCANVQVPVDSAQAPRFPLNGPSVVSLAIEKTDAAMRGYHARIITRWEDQKMVSILLDTPGTKTNRKIEATLKMAQNLMKLELDVDSPWKKLSAVYERKNTEKIQGASVKFISDSQVYGAKAMLKLSEAGEDSVYEPLLQYSTPSGEQNLIEGKIDFASGKKLNVDLRTDSPPQMSMLKGQIKADIRVKSHNKYQVNTLELNYPAWGVGKLGLSGSASYAEPTYAVNMVALYGESGHKLDINSTLTRIPMQKLALESHVKSTRNPAANVDLKWSVRVVPQTDALEHKFTMSQGMDEKKITIKQHSLYDAESSKNFEILNELQVTQPSNQVDFQLRMDAKKVEGRSQQYEFVVRNGQSHKAELKIFTGADAFFDYKCSAALQYPGQSYELSEVAHKSGPDTWNYATVYNAQPGSRYDAATVLVLKDNRNDIENSITTTITSKSLPQPIRFKSAFLKKTASVSAQFFLEKDGESKVDINTAYKYSGGKPHAIDMKALVKNYLNLELAESHTTTISNLDMKLAWIPSDRLIIAQSHMKLQGEQLSLDGTFKWDAGKDENKVAKIKSITHYGQGWSLDTQNEIVIEGKTVNVGLKGKLAKQVLNGEHSLDFTYRSPNNKNYGLSVKNHIETTPRTKSSKLYAKLQLADAQPYQIDWENRFANFDYERMTFEVLSDLKATYQGSQNLQIHGELNSLLTNKRVLNGQYGISGSSIPNPVSFDHIFELKSNGFRVATNGKQGAKAASVDVGLKYEWDVSSPRKSADLTYKVTLPSNPKSIEGSTRYLMQFKSKRNFEFSESGSVSLNSGVPTTWTNAIRVIDNEFQATSEVIDEGNQLFNFGLQGRKDKKRFVLDLQGLVRGHGAKFFTNVEGNFPFYNLRANGTLAPRSGKNYDFKLYHRSAQAGQSIDTEFTFLGPQKRFVLTNKLENYPKRKALDLLVTDGSTPRKIYVLLTENTPKWNLDSLIKWGEAGKMLTTKGGLELNNDLMDAVISMDSPALNIDKWSARASRKYSNGRHRVALNVEGKNERVVSLGIEYAKKNERHGETYDGSVKISAKKGQFDGQFRVENNQLDRKRDGEDGKQIKATVQLAGQSFPLKLTLLTKTTDLEKRFSVSFCNDGEQDCKVGDVIFRHEHHENDDVDYTLKITTQAIASGNKSTDGLLVTASRASHGRQFEHVAQLIINEEKESQIGYRIYRKVGKELGFDLQLPERLISTVAKADRQSGSDKAEISLWMDKSRKPEEKLSLLVAMGEVTSGDAQGTQTSIVVKHPAMSQDLKFKTKLIQGGQNTVLDFVAEIDAFKENGQLVLTTKVVRQSVHKGHTYVADVAVTAQTLALNVGVHSELKQTSSQVALQSEVSYENREKQMLKSKVELAYSEEHVIFAVGTPGTTPALSWSMTWNNREKHGSTGHDIRYEIMLPGMADARIFETQIHSSIPPHANVKMYTGSSAQGEFYEGFIGFQSDKQFAAGFYQQTPEERRTIGDWTLSLKSPRLLMVKADWDSANIEKALNDAQERLQQTGTNFKQIINSTMAEAMEEIQVLGINLAGAMPDLDPVAESYRQEIKFIRQELNTNPDTQAVSTYIAATENAVNKYVSWASDAAQSISEALENVFEQASRFAKALPSVLRSLTKKFPQMAESLKKSVDSMVDAVVRGANNAMNEIQRVIERITEQTGYNWDFLGETTSGVGKYLQNGLNYAIDGAVVVARFIESAAVSVMDNQWVKNTLSKTFVRYESLLASIVEEVKNQAESWRVSVLDAFPQKEAQDFILAVYEYAEKKAKSMPVDDAAAHKDIYEKFVAAVRKAGSELYTVDWKNGLVVAQIPLPKPINSLSDFDQLFLIEMPTWKFHLNQPSYTYGITEFFNFVKTDSIGNFFHRIFFSKDAAVPPVPAHALLIGSQYFRTFDGKFYHFEGNCQYLLASDFVDKNFTIAIDYEGDGPKILKTILIRYHGETATIKPDFSTVMKSHRGGQAELLRIEDSEKDGFLDIYSSNKEIAVTCSKKYDVCMFTLSGFYHGKSMGLLGTNNHEHHDDFSSPKGQVIENPEQFVASWKLDHQCQEKPIPPHPANASREARDTCKEAFHSKYSTLRSCYESVDPAPFQQVCEALSSEKGYTNRKAMCSASAAYAATCGNALVNVEVPTAC